MCLVQSRCVFPVRVPGRFDHPGLLRFFLRLGAVIVVHRELCSFSRAAGLIHRIDDLVDQAVQGTVNRFIRHRDLLYAIGGREDAPVEWFDRLISIRRSRLRYLIAARGNADHLTVSVPIDVKLIRLSVQWIACGSGVRQSEFSIRKAVHAVVFRDHCIRGTLLNLYRDRDDLVLHILSQCRRCRRGICLGERNRKYIRIDLSPCRRSDLFYIDRCRTGQEYFRKIGIAVRVGDQLGRYSGFIRCYLSTAWIAINVEERSIDADMLTDVRVIFLPIQHDRLLQCKVCRESARMIDKLDLLGVLNAEGELGDGIVPEPSSRRKLLNYVIGCLIRIIFLEFLTRFRQYNTFDKVILNSFLLFFGSGSASSIYIICCLRGSLLRINSVRNAGHS